MAVRGLDIKRWGGWCLLLLWGWLLGVPWCACAKPSPVSVTSTAPPAVVLANRGVWQDLWPNVQVLRDDSAQQSLDVILQRWRQGQAQPPQVPTANLGDYEGVVWLLWQVEVQPEAAGEWIFDVGYPPLDHADLFVIDAADRVQQWLNGDHQRLSARPLPSRTHAVPVTLSTGRYTVLMRVQTTGAMIVPVSVSTPKEFHQLQEREQLLQGLAAGIMLSLFFYSLAQWFSLRDPMFGYYALSLVSIALFLIEFQGIGPQHFWGDSVRVSEVLPPAAILLAVAGAFLFIDQALDIRSMSKRLSYGMKGGACAALLVLLLLLADLIHYRDAQRISRTIGLFPTLLALPVAWRRWRQGDVAAGYLLVGWGVYTLGSVQMSLLISGRLPANVWTLHGFQLASLTEVVMWLVVMGVRVETVRRQAEQARLDTERLKLLADTDALTGLQNRRGLQTAAEMMLARNLVGQQVGLYLIDLDGFKPVNDRWGHAAGDAVLVEVGRRLQAQVRTADVVSRTGGDEFVVLTEGLHSDQDAHRLGLALLEALLQPMTVHGHACHVGATIGYALAPQDSQTLEGLLAEADQALYAGKQAGKCQLRRG